MSESRVVLSRDFLTEYRKRFDKRFDAVIFQRQENGYLHNTVEWGNWLYDCLKRHDIDGMIKAINTVNAAYSPGQLSKDTFRSSKNLIISLISVIANYTARDRIIDNELALNTADVCIQMCEETRNREELLKTACAGLEKMSDLIQEYRNREYNYLVTQAKEYVFQHLHDVIEVKDIADFLHVSLEHLSRTFHKSEGITLKQYILQERLNRACNLLRFSDFSCSDIARYLGFSSQSHFGVLFKKMTGKTPKRYREDFSDAYTE